MKTQQLEQATIPPLSRDASIDAIRSLAMFLGVVLHAALGFTVSENPFNPKADASRWIGFDVALLLIHSFRMQLFFLVAGMFTAMLLARRTPKAFAAGRLRRIGLPLLVGAIVIAPLTRMPFIVPYFPRLNTTQIALVAWGGPAHLWFLMYLMIFSALGVLLFMCANAAGDKLRPVVEALGAGIASSWGPLLMIPPIIALTLLNDSLFIPTPPGWIPEAGTLAYYGLFFISGFCIHFSGRGDRFGRQWKWVLALTVLVSAPAVVSLPSWLPSMQLSKAQGTQAVARFVSGAAIQAVFTWGAIVALFGASKAALRHPRLDSPEESMQRAVTQPSVRSGQAAWLQWLAESSYWVYLVHLPVIYWAQLYFADVPLPGMARGPAEAVVKFLLILLASLTTSLGTYALFVRTTWLETVVGGGSANRRAGPPQSPVPPS